MDPVRVVVADDDERMRSALASVLADDPRVVVVDAVGSGSEAVQVATSKAVDVVVLDVRLPDGGEPTCQKLTALPGPPAVVAVSAMIDRGTVVSMLRAGASCYLAKDRIGTSLPEIAVRAAKGEVVIAVGGAQRMVADLVAL
jgi:DNA-binding NarL/FixJ family response regulator